MPKTLTSLKIESLGGTDRKELYYRMNREKLLLYQQSPEIKAKRRLGGQYYEEAEEE